MSVVSKFRSLTLSAVQPMLCTGPEHGTRQQFLVPRFTDGTFIGNPGHLPMAGGADLGEHQFAPDRANRLRIGSSVMTTPLLEVRHLKVELHSRCGTLIALGLSSARMGMGLSALLASLHREQTRERQ